MTFTCFLIEVNFVIINLMDNKCSRRDDIYLQNIVNNKNIVSYKLNWGIICCGTSHSMSRNFHGNMSVLEAGNCDGRTSLGDYE